VTTELTIHLEDVDGEVVWWADSPDVPGFSAAAPSLEELRKQAATALADILGTPVTVVERLHGETMERRHEADWDARVAHANPVTC
jgi:hypothetical protein